MLSMLLRAIHGRRPSAAELPPDLGPSFGSGPDPDQDPSPGPATPRAYAQLRHATADFDDEEIEEDSNVEQENEDGDHRSPNVLPLFSASHLDSLPVYHIVHAIRIIVQARTETTLTWEQLRSPQVSQFLVKPMQQQIRAQHFSRATLYTLMANCLQFTKEAQLNPGNAGTSTTRAKVCELLAIKLLKEYTTRELIDALSYDFNPLQGLAGSQPQYASSAGLSRDGRHQRLPPTARISTLEIAIRASAKHFLAHPLVVQQLEAIWNGAISFYSSADSLHRDNGKAPVPSYPAAAAANGVWTRRGGAARGGRRRSSAHDHLTPLLEQPDLNQTSYHGQQPQTVKEEQGRSHLHQPIPAQSLYRRTVSLYDPRSASLFKLSRLRVPRYRQFFSTCSLAVLIGLFLAVLVQHSNRITSLELVFWVWSAGFMLDELVGFNEQGFSLYIMSFWNIFDLGILLLLIIYYSLRICGVFLADAQRWNDNAYDILAANAILLLPRIFSSLDHIPYFSQLLIAFRLMAADLAAVFILILVSCSGFFVFFTLSRSDNNAGDVAYQIFQLLMGFTPAAWEVWSTYNYLGKTLMALFLIICHFVVVTILITVLTNSFMAIASNANEEHQFLFAINTISMVKNDALFSYVAPTNIFAWMLMPLRYFMPLPHFVALNRLVIKVTHLPLLFGIFLYEKFFLAPFMYEPTDLVENSRRARGRLVSFADPGARNVLFSPSIRVREESEAGFRKDRALDEVFRRTPDIASLRTQRRNERRKTQTAIRNWMDQNDGLVDSPHNYSTINEREANEWRRRMSVSREHGGTHRFRHMPDVRSTASDPADLLSLSALPVLSREPTYDHADALGGPFEAAFKDHTDAEGDDELVTNDDEEENTTNTGGPGATPLESRDEVTREDGEEDGEEDEEDGDFFATPTASRFLDAAARSPQSSHGQEEDKENEPVRGGRNLEEIAASTASPPKPAPRKALHSRALSSNTILYNPPNADSGDDVIPLHQSPGSMFSPPSPRPVPQPSRPKPVTSRYTSPVAGTPTASSGHRSPRKPANQGAVLPRPILPPRDQTQSAASRATAIFNSAAMLDTPVRRAQRRMSSFDIGTDAQSDLTSAVGGPMGDDATFGGALPGSFTSQLALATAMKNARANDENDRDRDRMSRLVLARMKTLEESFTDVVRELRMLQRQQEQHHSERMTSGSSVSNSEDGDGQSEIKSGSRVPTMAAVHPVGSGAAASPGKQRRAFAGETGGRQQHARLSAGSGEGDGRGRKAKGKEVERPAIHNPEDEAGSSRGPQVP